MMKVPVENLSLFGQLDRIVVAFFRKQQSSSPYDWMSVLHKDTLTRKKQELRTISLSKLSTTREWL